MSDEFDAPVEPQVSAFWPLLIVILTLVIFFGEQDYYLNHQRVVNNEQLQNAMPQITQARYYADRYVKLMRDLAETGQKNAVAANIIRDAMKAGWIRQNPNGGGTNSTETPTAPAATDTH